MCTCGCEDKALKDFDPDTEEKYFVCSNSDAPEFIYFDKDSAFNDQFPTDFIDSFDENGEKVSSYKWIDGSYTEDF